MRGSSSLPRADGGPLAAPAKGYGLSERLPVWRGGDDGGGEAGRHGPWGGPDPLF